jgi:hypothetical protein
VTEHQALALGKIERVPVRPDRTRLGHRVERNDPPIGQPRIETVLVVLGHPLAPLRQRRLEILAAVGDEPGTLVVLGGRVLGEFGDREKRRHTAHRRREDPLGRAVERVQIGTEQHDPELGTSAEHGKRHRLIRLGRGELRKRLTNGVRASTPPHPQHQVHHAPAVTHHQIRLLCVHARQAS